MLNWFRRTHKDEDGIFLADLMLASIGFSILMGSWMLLKAEEAQNNQYAATGIYIGQFTQAVREFVSANSATIVAGATTTYTGTAFLKSTTCGGTILAPQNPFLPCSFNNSDPMGRVPTTDVGNELAVTGAGSAGTAIGRTVYPPIIKAGKLRMDIAEKIIDKAEGISYASSAGSSQNTYVNITLDRTAVAGNRGRIFSDTTVSNPATELYIRRDGTNSPTAAINWGGQNLSNVNTLAAITANVTTLTATGVIKGKDVQTNAGRTLQKAIIIEDIVPLSTYRPAAQPTWWFSYATISTAGMICDAPLTIKIFANVVASGNNAVSNGWITYVVPAPWAGAGALQIRVRNHTTKWDASDMPAYAHYILRCM